MTTLCELISSYYRNDLSYRITSPSSYLTCALSLKSFIRWTNPYVWQKKVNTLQTYLHFIWKTKHIPSWRFIVNTFIWNIPYDNEFTYITKLRRWIMCFFSTYKQQWYSFYRLISLLRYSLDFMFHEVGLRLTSTYTTRWK